MLAAGLLDQATLAAPFIFFMGVMALAWFSESERLRPVVFVSVGCAIFMPLVVAGLLIRSVVRFGSSVGMLLVGVRYTPLEDVHWYEEGVEYVFRFWPNLVEDILLGLTEKAWPSPPPAEPHPEPFVLDTRARTVGGRFARFVLAMMLIVSPVPLFAAFLV